MIRWLFCFLTFAAFAEAGTLRVGVTAGPHAQIMEMVAELAKKEGITLEVKEFNDFVMPNQALSEGSLDVNSFQHEPYLKEQVKQREFKIKSVGKTVLMPLRGYSKKIKKIDELKEGDIVAIPNDPTNEARALRLLAAQKLVTLKDVENPSMLDIQDNPKKLVIKQIEAPMLPRSLDDAVLCIINTDWVMVAGLDPKTAIFSEGAKGNPYANVLVVRDDACESSDIKKFIELYQSETVKQFIHATFKEAVIPAW